jgi:hypothetical protein
MIEGLKLDFTSEELKNHIPGRAAYHKGRSDWYEQQVKTLKDGGLQRTDMSLDPVRGFRK